MDQTTQDQVRSYQAIQGWVTRYFTAVYGRDFVFKAPETFPNMLERWMLYATRPDGESMAEKAMQEIEAHIEAARKEG